MKPILYTWGTPNGQKPIILLEELGIPYDLVRIDIGKGEQKRPEYLAINPNGRIPAMVDEEGLTVWESGAILFRLASQHGRFLPVDPQARLDALAWLFWQVGGPGPTLGQAFHFRNREEKLPYAIERFTAEGIRLYTVLEARLAEVPYLAGEYSIADMACWTWMRNGPKMGIDMAAFPHTQRWIDAIALRPAVQRALAVTFGG
ncbi:MAG: glutathione S-transferase N-terminal domain-containing protein [Pseudomonadota bacterium]|nr:glutathione S-transferase N-terminal domain-containing protein [Pseudomonadota bacterium]